MKHQLYGKPELRIPNKVMRELYSDYFLKILSDELNFRVDDSDYNDIIIDIMLKGNIEKYTKMAEEYLNGLSNRDYIKFDEKYIKIIFFCIAMNFKTAYWVKSEMEIQRKYPDLLLVPKQQGKGYYTVMIEFKYLKKEEESKLKEKQEEARTQLLEYAEFKEIKSAEKLRKYTIVAINDKVHIEEII